MIPEGAGVVALTAWLMLAVLTVALLLTFLRLARGPSLPDRVVALDVIATLVVGKIGLYAIAQAQPVLLRVAMTVALIGFIGTVAFAWYLQRRIAR
ncbi:MAG TPA: monovalent cation/H+ antiporter complex subunit F [Planctomycetaceae bacterium]|nr:monovalent cation/H+ antiporter complex subunit F [Planctomycetaceae bacterium]